MKLTLRHLSHERNHHVLWHAIDCELQAGDLLQLQGANGSGKSTLLRILAGLIEPSHGTVTWQDQSIFRQLDFYQRQLHYVGHKNGIKPQLTVQENLQLSAALFASRPTQHQLHTAIEQVGLSHTLSTQAIHLSAGQLRRLTLARLLLNPALLWLLDEPTTALDTQGQILFATLLNQHITQGGMAVVATHHNLPIAGSLKTIHLGTQHV